MKLGLNKPIENNIVNKKQIIKSQVSKQEFPITTKVHVIKHPTIIAK